MNKQTKSDIIQAAKDFMKFHSLSQKTVADQSGINASYLNSMLKGETAVIVQEKPVSIPDKWFILLARYCGYVYDKEYWPFVETRELGDIINVLEFAKESAYTNIVICDSGYGKTYAVKKFKKRHPHHTHIITASRLSKISEILEELVEIMNIPFSHINSVRLKRIVNKMRDVGLSDGKPIIIIDEAENLKLPVLQTLKALYDGVHEFCAIVLIGTSKLIEKLDKMESRNVDGMPQFCRRFRMGRRVIRQVNDFKPFFEKLNITDAGVINMATLRCRSYGELHDFLEPVIKYADQTDQLLTASLLTRFHHM